MPFLTPLETEALLLSLRVAVVSALCSLPAGLAVAWLLVRGRFPGKAVVDAIVHLPLVLPPVVVGYLLLVVLGRRGFVGEWLYDAFGITIAFTWKGAAVAAAAMAFPLMVRAMRLSLESVDRGLEAAARTLGAGRGRVVATITLPLMAPGILAGAILAFARALGEFGATITFVSNIPGETRTLPIALYTLIQTPDGEAGAARLAVIAAILAFAALGVSEWLARRVRHTQDDAEIRP
jgi:molybdate transport system permease protein